MTYTLLQPWDFRPGVRCRDRQRRFPYSGRPGGLVARLCGVQRFGGAEGVAISALLWHPTAASPRHESPPEAQAADHGRNGAVLLSSSLDGHVTVWDLQRQQPQVRSSTH